MNIDCDKINKEEVAFAILTLVARSDKVNLPSGNSWGKAESAAMNQPDDISQEEK